MMDPAMKRTAAFALRQGAKVLCIAFVIFLLVRAVPGDVTDFYAARGDYDAAQLEAMRVSLGLDASLPQQFGRWAWHALHGDMGESMRFGAPVGDMIANALPTSLVLSGGGLALGLLLGVTLAVAGLAFPRSRIGPWIESLNLWSIAVPTFCLGILCILVFSVWLKWLPIRGQMFLPIVIIGIDIAGQIVKPLYEELKETAQAAFVRTAHAKGLSRWRVAWRHMLPNSLSVVVALSGVILGGLIGGTLTMEALFGLPGIGSLTLDAIRGRDYPVIQAAVVTLAAFVVLINLLTVAMHRKIDPRLARANPE
ncbi:peptide/nickel transport system permease protein [Pigmentiphaga litoralis]|uniref:Peptide/nickel transport system permease protein n=2 Tax=Pigmentiphaga litoralis TaxID=516702 RepID=A0A7Y9IRX2_9BURK|nr:ABC transporter permease [Pigmentiphaga litoralis]NYE24540.1 peptide/nickel transport system permease protein [Pigmentiphaga litoralis]NYE81846.1 peptide/nickel transport system permease protein [Pigmentiphaga litoralis]